MIKLTLILALLIIASCSGSRIKDSYTTTVYTKEGCDKILTELGYARRYKKSLHKNDKFMLRHMLVIPAIIETYNITRNDGKVTRRIDDLKAQAQANNCYENEADAYSSFAPYQQDADYAKIRSQQKSSSSSGSKSLISGFKGWFK